MGKIEKVFVVILLITIITVWIVGIIKIIQKPDEDRYEIVPCYDKFGNEIKEVVCEEHITYTNEDRFMLSLIFTFLMFMFAGVIILFYVIIKESFCGNY